MSTLPLPRRPRRASRTFCPSETLSWSAWANNALRDNNTVRVINVSLLRTRRFDAGQGLAGEQREAERMGGLPGGDQEIIMEGGACEGSLDVLARAEKVLIVEFCRHGRPRHASSGALAFPAL